MLRIGTLLPALLSLVFMALTLTTPTAMGAQAADTPPSPVGAWLGIFPDAPRGAEPGRVLVTINADDTLLVLIAPTFVLSEQDSPAARLYNTIGHGSWEPAGERQYRVMFVFLFFDKTGAYFAMQEIHSVLTLALDGATTTTVDSGRVILANGSIADSFEDEPGPRLTRIRS